MKKIGLFLVICLAALSTSAQTILKNDDIIRLYKAGLSEKVIALKIENSAGSFDTSIEGLITLTESGLSQSIIEKIVLKQDSIAPNDNLSTDEEETSTPESIDANVPPIAPELKEQTTESQKVPAAKLESLEESNDGLIRTVNIRTPVFTESDESSNHQSVNVPVNQEKFNGEDLNKNHSDDSEYSGIVITYENKNSDQRKERKKHKSKTSQKKGSSIFFGGGINASRMQYDWLSSNIGLGFQGGLDAILRSKGAFTINFGLGYSFKRTSIEEADFALGLFNGNLSRYNIGYIQVPLTFGVVSEKEGAEYTYFGLGGYSAFPVHANFSRVDESGTALTSGRFDISSFENDFGGLLRIMMVRRSFFFGLDLEYGLSGLVYHSKVRNSLMNRALRLNIGIKL